MHPGQLEVQSGQVETLISEQFPGWAGQPVVAVPSAGTVNAIFRIGQEPVASATARFPLQPGDVAATWDWLREEAAVATWLNGRVPAPTPIPLGLGQPGAGYPLPWSLQTWLPGVTATSEAVGDSLAFAVDLGRWVAALRAQPTDGRRFSGTWRGGRLTSQDEVVGQTIPAGAHLIDAPAVL